MPSHANALLGCVSVFGIARNAGLAFHTLPLRGLDSRETRSNPKGGPGPTSRVAPLLVTETSTAKANVKKRKKVKGQKQLPDLSQGKFPPIPDEPYDLVVLGSGPGGEAAAVQASRLGATVAVVEIKSSFGGPTGLTSKAVREAAKQIVKAVDQIGGDRRRQIRRMWAQGFPKLRSEAEVLQAAESRDRLQKNQCQLFIGSAEIIKGEESLVAGELAVRVCRPTGCVELPAHHVCIATGSRPNRPATLPSGCPLPFTKGVLVDATEIGKLTELPNAVAIIGGGVIAVEYANVLASLGVGVSLICKEEAFMPFLPEELRIALKKRMKRLLPTIQTRDHVLFVTNELQRIDIASDNRVRMLLEEAPMKPRRLVVDLVLFSGGRDANSFSIGCEQVGVALGRYGRIKVDSMYRTSNPRIYAVGDVIGPPGLASSAQMGGRAVASTLFHNKMEKLRQMMLEDSTEMEDFIDDEFFSGDYEPLSDEGGGMGGAGVSSSGKGTTPDDTPVEEMSDSLFDKKSAPLTLWTIPEISSVGLSEEQAMETGLKRASNGGSIVVGYAYFKDLARGRLSGDPDGFLKVVSRCDGPYHHTVIGVQIFGEGANELIQLGSILVYGESTLEEVSNTPFAAVTLSGLYQMASDDALCNSPYNLQQHPKRSLAYHED
ncbi:unnamed protein product [Discosporangium mesarthrocarpum]